MHATHVVCFLQRLTHYREVFFQRVKNRLNEKNIEFSLVHGLPDAVAQTKRDSGFIPWAYVVKETKFSFGNLSVVWLPLPPEASSPDMIILPQENKLLANYVWIFRRIFGGPKLAFWGHGRNFQSSAPAGLRERWKRMLVGRVDWWLAYTEMTRDILLNDSYPDSRITVLDTAIDNDSFQRELASVSEDQLSSLREEICADVDAPVGLFCGSLYPDKRIGFMIEAVDRIHESLPSFRFVVIGDGPSFQEVKSAAETRPWMKWAGVCKGPEKAAYFRLATLMICPGAIGLNILDSFCSGVPVVTTPIARHGPELAYLKNGVNGLLVGGDVNDYSDAVVGLLLDQSRLASIKRAAIQEAQHYTLDNMVSNFVEGIEQCLAMPRK